MELRRELLLRVRYFSRLGVFGSVISGLISSGFSDTADGEVYEKDGKLWRVREARRVGNEVKFELVERTCAGKPVQLTIDLSGESV
jgi:hypothetical protein